jgi:hypothetical protein
MIGIMERTTMDMDTTANGINMDEYEISNIIKEILLIDVGDDIRFEFEKLELPWRLCLMRHNICIDNMFNTTYYNIKKEENYVRN